MPLGVWQPARVLRVCGSAATLLVMPVLLAGCGDGSQTLTASDFIDRINAEGVSIELGERVATSGGAEDQLEACQGSGGLLCFRAENIVVILDEESSGLTAQRLAVAVRRLTN
jgi:hypothetical protein